LATWQGLARLAWKEATAETAVTQLYGNPVYIWYLGTIPDFAKFCMDELHTKVPRTDKSTGKTSP
jgi:hypothetical protein